MNPTWQQKKLRKFCKGKGIHVTAYAPLGAYKDVWGQKLIMENKVLEKVSKVQAIFLLSFLPREQEKNCFQT